MRSALLLLALLAVAARPAPAQAPRTLSHQGFLEQNGTPVNGSVPITFHLFAAASGGTALWTEAHPAVAVADGVYGVTLGGLTSLDGVDFNRPLWLQLRVDGTTLAPRTALTGVPVAMTLPAGATVSGAVTTGSLAALRGVNTATSGAVHGLYGETATTNGGGAGVYGTAPQTGVLGNATTTGTTTAIGVAGISTAPSGVHYGVWGTSASTTGRGVLGWATASTGASYGVYGVTQSTTGRGVYGHADASTGESYGVYGRSDSPDGYGVYGSGPTIGIFGRTTGATPGGYGVWGETTAPEGEGVLGYARSTTGTASGVAGWSAAPAGRGVWGAAFGSSGANYGVFGESGSPTGHGVHGQAPVYAVYGNATFNNHAPNYAVYGNTASLNGYGVYGTAPTNGAGNAVGVYGRSNANTGFGGYFTGHTGVYGHTSSTIGYAGHFQKSVNAGGGDPTAYVLYARNPSTGSSPDVLALSVGTTTPGAAVNFVGFFAAATNLIGQIEGNGAGGVSYTTSGADYAERLPRLIEGEALLPGDVVGVFGGRASRRTHGAERVMVVSSNPAVVGNGAGDADGRPAVAFVGQVAVRVVGPAAVGDVLVASGREDGTAVAVAPAAWEPAAHGAPVGRAWEAKADAGEGLLNAAVGVDDLAGVVALLSEQRARLAALEARLAALERPRYPVTASH